MGVFEESFESAFGNVAFILWKFSKDIYFFFAVSLTEGEFSCFHVYRVFGWRWEYGLWLDDKKQKGWMF